MNLSFVEMAHSVLKCNHLLHQNWFACYVSEIRLSEIRFIHDGLEPRLYWHWLMDVGVCHFPMLSSIKSKMKICCQTWYDEFSEKMPSNPYSMWLPAIVIFNRNCIYLADNLLFYIRWMRAAKKKCAESTAADIEKWLETLRGPWYDSKMRMCHTEQNGIDYILGTCVRGVCCMCVIVENNGIEKSFSFSIQGMKQANRKTAYMINSPFVRIDSVWQCIRRLFRYLLLYI